MPSFGLIEKSLLYSMDITGFKKNSGRIPAKIVVVGDCLLDEYYQVKANRISPEFPILAYRSNDFKPNAVVPGGAGNVALQLKHFNADVKLVGILDGSSADTYEKAGVDTRFTAYYGLADWTIPIKRRLYDGNYALCRWDIEMPNYGIDDIESAREWLDERYQVACDKGCDVTIFSDYDKGVFSDENRHWRNLADLPCMTIVDPKKNTSLDRWKGCQIFKPNAEEARLLSGYEEWKRQCDFFQNRLGCQAVVITHGSEGVVGKLDGDYLQYEPLRKVKFESVVGAGDTFVAFLAMGLAKNMHLYEAIGLAFEAGAVYVQKHYNSPITPYELQRHFNPERAKFVTREELAEIAQIDTLVMTNGVFDFCHVGHLQCLNYAKSLAGNGKLVVAVNTDESVKRLKGDGRPINSLAERMEALAALECVDYVCPFDEDTPLELIKQVMPAMLVKGNDYQEEDVPGYGIVPIKIVPFPTIKTTTEIVEKIKRNL